MRLRFAIYFSHYFTTQIIMSYIFKEDMETWTETIELPDLVKKKLYN